MDKRAYYIEDPEKGTTLILLDNGIHQEIMTAESGYALMWQETIKEWGYEPRMFQRQSREVAQRNACHQLDGSRRPVFWTRLDGHSLEPGFLNGLRPKTIGAHCGEEPAS